MRRSTFWRAPQSSSARRITSTSLSLSPGSPARASTAAAGPLCHLLSEGQEQGWLPLSKILARWLATLALFPKSTYYVVAQLERFP